MKNIINDLYEVRAVEKGDVENIAALERECFAVPMSAENIKSFLLGENGLGIVCYSINEPQEMCAYCGALCILDEAQVLNVATAKAHRQKGLGRLVTESLIEAARQKAIATMTLEVRESNSAARGLYDSLGFYEIGRIKKYYSKPAEDALILKLDIEK